MAIRRVLIFELLFQLRCQLEHTLKEFSNPTILPPEHAFPTGLFCTLHTDFRYPCAVSATMNNNHANYPGRLNFIQNLLCKRFSFQAVQSACIFESAKCEEIA